MCGRIICLQFFSKIICSTFFFQVMETQVKRYPNLKVVELLHQRNQPWRQKRLLAQYSIRVTNLQVNLVLNMLEKFITYFALMRKGKNDMLFDYDDGSVCQLGCEMAEILMVVNMYKLKMLLKISTS